MAANVFNRYIWLVDTINRAGRISFEEINKKWLRTDWSEGQKILFGEIPSGQLFLTTIIEAMRDGVTIQFQYKPFWYSEIPEIEIKPYCIKIFKQRWYVLGENIPFNEMRIYALDRIQSITATNTKFKLPKDFHADNYFENAYGIVVYPEIAACRKYIQTLPLHHSQQEVESNEEFSILKYFIAPTKDFMQEILSHSNEIEVLSPEGLRNEIADKIKEMNKLYKK